MNDIAKFAASRRTVLKGGTAAIALATVGTPFKMAFAANAVRYDIASAKGQAMLEIYKTAVGKMKDAAINNPPQPTSWTFQAYIHSLPVDPTDPTSAGYKNGSKEFIAKVNQIYGNPASGTKEAAWRDAALKCWSTCPHGSPYFLPWHRWYMFYFEQVVRTMSGDPSFTLPYWSYASNQDSSLVLPEAFRDAASPLFESIRGNGFSNPEGTGSQNVPMNSGGYMAYSLIDYNPSLLATQYYPADVGPLPDSFSPDWYKLGYTGRTEINPHDFVHDGVGGLMGNVPTAAADPVFYVHHCQIDHLWASWQSYPGNQTINFGQPPGTPAQPSQAAWDGQTWYFVDGTGALVSVDAPKAVDYTALGYDYDSLAPKPQDAQPVAAVVLASTAGTGAGAPAAVAKTGALTVGAAGASATLAPTATTNGAKSMLSATAPATTLVLQDVKLVQRPPAPLYVFVNLPEGAKPDITGPSYVGAINMFTLTTSLPGGDGHGHEGHGAGGADFSFHVKDVLTQQAKSGQWDGGSLKVTVTTADAGGAPGQTYVVIGSISLR